MKKAQTEVIGLIVIVVLFILIGFFFLIFSSGDDSTNREIRQSAEVTNLLTSIMRLTPCQTEIPPLSMEDIIKNCHTSNLEYCGFDCKAYIEKVLEDSIKAYNPSLSYEFKINDFISTSPCSSSQVLVDHYTIRIGSTNLVSELKICI